jgi:hypothetical protein
MNKEIIKELNAMLEIGTYVPANAVAMAGRMNPSEFDGMNVDEAASYVIELAQFI